MALLFSLCLFWVVASLIWYSWKYGITPTPTSPKVRQKLLDLLPPLSGGEIAELGSGWGTLAFALSRKFPSCKITALEISPVPFFCSWLISKGWSYPNLEIMRCDFFDYSLQSTTMVVCYLYPGAMERLKSKFLKELKPEAYVVSHTFAVPGWKPLLIARASDLYRTPVYVYQLKMSTS